MPVASVVAWILLTGFGLVVWIVIYRRYRGAEIERPDMNAFYDDQEKG